MTGRVEWHFRGDSLIVVSRTPPLPRELQIPLVSLLAELTDSRQAMEDFLEVWREHKYRFANDPEEPLVGSHCEIQVVGDMVQLYPLYEGEWEGIEEARLPLNEVEDMFAAYSAWAYGAQP